MKGRLCDYIFDGEAKRASRSNRVEVIMVTQEQVMEALREVYDPEIPVNVVDLGLIYKVKVKGGKVEVDMTMTARGCPMHAYIAEETRKRLLEIEGVEEAEVNIVWEPPWNPTMISEEARKRLGLG